MINGRSIIVLLATTLVACSSANKKQQNFKSQKMINSPGVAIASIPLKPKGLLYNGDGLPVIQHVLPRSVAEKAGLQRGDRITKFNDGLVLSVSDFERRLKNSPKSSTIEFIRNGKPLRQRIILAEDKPRLGAGFEPSDRVLVKQNTPIIGILHKENFSVYAKTSATKDNKIRISLIIQGNKPSIATPLTLRVFEKNSLKPIGQLKDVVDATSLDPIVFSKDFQRNDQDLQLPIRLDLALANEKFLFEFQ